MADLNQIELPNGSTYSFKDDSAVANITRSGTTFTATKRDGTTFTFTQQDNNTTYSMTRDGANVKLTPSSGTAQTVGLSDLINGLGEGTSPAQGDDYLVAQYAGGGTTTTSYHRRAVKNIVNATNVKTALGTGSSTTTYLNNAGNWATPPDTKNTAGSTDTSSKIFLIGATSQAANPQTYSDDQVYVTNGTLTAQNIVSPGVICCSQTAGTAGGISLYSGTGQVTSYGIAMRVTSNSGKHGYVQGDWANYFYFDGATNRGLVYRHAGSPVASVSGAGHAVFNGSITIGGNTTNTSGARMEYNATTQAIDFVFN